MNKYVATLLVIAVTTLSSIGMNRIHGSYIDLKRIEVDNYFKSQEIADNTPDGAGRTWFIEQVSPIHSDTSNLALVVKSL